MGDFTDDALNNMSHNFDDTSDSKANGENADNQDYQDADQDVSQESNNIKMDRGSNGNNNDGTKISDDEERKLFLGGLSWETTDDDIKTYFGKFGAVQDVSIKYDAVTSNPRGFGFITFCNESTIDEVLASGPHQIRNKTIDPKRAKTRPICKKIFVGGVDANMSEEEIKKYFSRFGTVEGIELPFDRQRNRRREFCFIIFDTEEAAEMACKEAKQRIGSKECDIKKAQPQPVAQQQKRMQQQQQQSSDYANGSYGGGSGYSRGGYSGGRGGRRNQSSEQGASSYGDSSYGSAYGGQQTPYNWSQYYQQYPNYQGGYDGYGGYYGSYGYDYYNQGYYPGYQGYGDASQTATADYSSTGMTDPYGTAPSQTTSTTHSSGHASGGKMPRKSGTSSGARYDPYR